MKIALIILLIYLGQALVCGIINAIVPNRMPSSLKDLAKLTFLPWLLLHLKDVRD